MKTDKVINSLPVIKHTCSGHEGYVCRNPARIHEHQDEELHQVYQSGHLHSKKSVTTKNKTNLLNSLISYIPLEKHLNKLGNGFSKQIALMVSNLTPAFVVSELLNIFNTSPFIKSPVSIFSMHLLNKGNEKVHKPFLTSIGSIGILALQKFVGLPRALIRPLMAIAVFAVEKIFPDKSNNNSHERHHQMGNISRKDEHKNHEHTEDGIALLLGLGKLEVLMNTVPLVVDYLSGRLFEDKVSSSNNFLDKVTNTALNVLFKIGALSLGFTGAGNLINLLLKNIARNIGDKNLAAKIEGVVCACCGGVVCVSEVSAEGAVEAVKYVS